MGMDIKGTYNEDPGYWAKCSCGKYSARGNNKAEVIDLVTKHYRENKDTHSTGSGGGAYMLHVPPKRKWYQRAFGTKVVNLY